jgi:hypothetical protein
MHTTHTKLQRLVAQVALWACLALVAAAMIAQAALAGGEPKNQSPFTRPVGDRTTQNSTRLVPGVAAPQGEAKNELPFTRIIGQPPASGGFVCPDVKCRLRTW